MWEYITIYKMTVLERIICAYLTKTKKIWQKIGEKVNILQGKSKKTQKSVHILTDVKTDINII